MNLVITSVSLVTKKEVVITETDVFFTETG